MFFFLIENVWMMMIIEDEDIVDL